MLQFLRSTASGTFERLACGISKCQRVSIVRDRSGVAAVEFALIAPVLLVLYVAGSEAATATIINRKVQHTASSIANLLTRQTKTTATEVRSIFHIAGSVMTPYDNSRLTLTATMLWIDASGNNTVKWSVSSGPTRDTAGTAVTVPSNFSSYRSRALLLVKSSYRYEPFGGYGSMKPFRMGGTSYYETRTGKEISCSDCS